MGQITSREELEEWLKDKPADWAQVIAARAALRVLPHGLHEYLTDEWAATHLLALFRAAAMSWTVPNFSAQRITAAASAAAGAAFTAADATKYGAYAFNAEAYAALSAVDTSFAATTAYSRAVDAAANATADAAYGNGGLHAAHKARTAYWTYVSHDCNELIHKADIVSASQHLTKVTLWLDGLAERRAVAVPFATRLLTLDPTYQVWIDWYNRRIEGHDAAFDIPGDIDRTHDKAILARLADASDEDFWGKGATYVNTTLQRWIDEARIEARIEDILRKLRGGASAHYGAPEELAGRAALLHELDRLLGKSPQARHGIGGNHPPEPIDAPEQPVALPQEMREPLEAISTELEKREPNALVVVEKVKLLHRVGRKLEKMVDVASDEFAKSVGGELGKLVVKGLFWLAVINQILDWLTPLIQISG